LVGLLSSTRLRWNSSRLVARTMILMELVLLV
jgi:hypothetical protein